MSFGRRVVNLLRRRGWTWKWLLNPDRALSHRLFDHPDPALSGDDLGELCRNGIIVRPAARLLTSGGLANLHAARQAIAEQLASARAQQFLEHGDAHSAKAFRLGLLPATFEGSSPFVHLALEPGLLALANAYLGMRSLVRSIAAWLDVPTGKPPTETQLWHRDDDDFSNLKVFIYLVDVAPDNGPFCFIPRTHPGGNRRVPAHFEKKERVGDEEMAKVIAPNEWKICTGRADTVIIADTRGYHKGLQPRQGHRQLLTFQYTSGKPLWASDLCVSSPVPLPLTAPQRWALAG